MFPNAKGSESLALLGTVDPVSQGIGTVTTGWINTANFHKFLALINSGVLGVAATLDAKIQQAQDGTGTGAKDVTGKAIIQIVKATGDNKQALINLRGEDLDITNNFTHVRLSMTVGGAASLVSGAVLGMSPRYAPASALNQAAVAEVVG